MDKPIQAEISYYGGPFYYEESEAMTELLQAIPGKSDELESSLRARLSSLGDSLTVKVNYHTSDGHACRALVMVGWRGGRGIAVSIPQPGRCSAIYSTRTTRALNEQFVRAVIKLLQPVPA